MVKKLPLYIVICIRKFVKSWETLKSNRLYGARAETRIRIECKFKCTDTQVTMGNQQLNQKKKHQSGLSGYHTIYPILMIKLQRLDSNIVGVK